MDLHQCASGGRGREGVPHGHGLPGLRPASVPDLAEGGFLPGDHGRLLLRRHHNKGAQLAPHRPNVPDWILCPQDYLVAAGGKPGFLPLPLQSRFLREVAFHQAAPGIQHLDLALGPAVQSGLHLHPAAVKGIAPQMGVPQVQRVGFQADGPQNQGVVDDGLPHVQVEVDHLLQVEFGGQRNEGHAAGAGLLRGQEEAAEGAGPARIVQPQAQQGRRRALVMDFEDQPVVPAPVRPEEPTPALLQDGGRPLPPPALPAREVEPGRARAEDLSADLLEPPGPQRLRGDEIGEGISGRGKGTGSPAGQGEEQGGEGRAGRASHLRMAGLTAHVEQAFLRWARRIFHRSRASTRAASALPTWPRCCSWRRSRAGSSRRGDTGHSAARKARPRTSWTEPSGMTIRAVLPKGSMHVQGTDISATW